MSSVVELDARMRQGSAGFHRKRRCGPGHLMGIRRSRTARLVWDGRVRAQRQRATPRREGSASVWGARAQVVVVRDVSHDLSTRMLLSVAAKGEAALEDLTQAWPPLHVCVSVH